MPNVIANSVVLTVLNHFPNGKESRTLTHKLDRWAHKVGSSPVVEFTLSFTANRTNATTGLVDNLGNDYTVEDAYIEYNGISVQATFSIAGSNVISNGSNDIQCDPIPATAFGVSTIPAGAVFWVKTRCSLPLATDSMPYSALRNGNDYAGSQTVFYDPGVATITNITETGPFVITGASTSRINGMSPIVLGRSISDGVHRYIATGDSITQGTGDSELLLSGRGWFQRAMDQLGRASINLACHGSQSTLGQQAKLQNYYQYANRGIIFYGTNDFGSSGTSTTVGALQTKLISIKDAMVSAGIAEVSVCGLLPRGTTTDDFQTEANQTPYAGWDELTDNPYTFNASLSAIGADKTIIFQSVRGVDTFKWVVDGTVDYSTADGTHPTLGGASLMAADFAASLISVAYNGIKARQISARAIAARAITARGV